MEQDPYDFALDDNSDSSDSDESYVKPLTVPPVERKLAHVNILDKAKALLEKRNVGGLNAKSSASSSSSSLASTSQESEIAQDGNAYEDVKKTITIPQVDDESEDYSEDEEEETSLESGIESDIEFPDIEEAQERAEAKPPCSFGKEEKRAQAKRQRAARESAVREAFVESPKTIDFATQYYVEFSVCLGSVSAIILCFISECAVGRSLSAI